MDVFDLRAAISVDTSQYDQALDDSAKKSKSFSSKLGSGLKTAAKVGAVALTAVTTAGAALGKTLFSGADAVAAYGDNVDKMSQKMGISAKAYQEWDAVLQHSGTSIEALKPSMKTLATQAQKNAEEFQKLGISQKELAELSQEDLFARVISGLQGMEEGTERTAITSKLLGRGAVELGALLNTSAEETQKMKDRVHELGGVMSDEAVKASAKFKDNLQDLQTAFQGIKRGLASEFLPALNDLMDGFTKLLAGEEGAEQALDSGMDKLDGALNKIMPKIGTILEKLLPRIITIGGELIGAFAQQVPKIIVAIAKQVPAIAKSLIAAFKKVFPEMIKAGMDLLRELAKGIKNGSSSVSDTIVEILKMIGDVIIENLPEIVMLGLDILESLIDGIMDNLPKIVTAIFEMIDRLISTIIERLPEILEKGKDILLSLVQGIRENLPKLVSAAVELIKKLAKTIIENLPEILQAGIQLILELGKGILEALPDLLAQIPQIIIDLVGALLDPENIGKIIDAGFQMIGSLFEGLFSGDFGETAGKIIEALLGAVLAIPGLIMDIGSKIVGFIFDGIKSAWNGVVDWVESGIEALFGDVNKARDEALAALNSAYTDEYYAEKRQGARNRAAERSGTTGMNYAGAGSQVAIYSTTYIGGKKLNQTVTTAGAGQNAKSGGH